MLTILKGLVKGAIVSALAMFMLVMILLVIFLGPVMIPALIVLLVLGGLGVLDYKCVVKPIARGIKGIFAWIINCIKGVIGK